MDKDPILSLFGENLTESLTAGDASDTDILTQVKIKAFGWPLLNYVVRLLNRRVPMYFVSEEFDFLLRYMKALELFVAYPQHRETFIKEYPLWELDDLWCKEFYTLDMLKLLTHTDQNDALWHEILEYLSSEEIRQKYIFVIANLPDLYRFYPKTLGDRPAEFFWKTRNRTFQFIAPMSWQEYAQYLEVSFNLLHYVAPILFSPRPEGIPEYPHIGDTPDKRYTYE
jgi:hypothetical protein